jgi:hypothetical protein
MLASGPDGPSASISDEPRNEKVAVEFMFARVGSLAAKAERSRSLFVNKIPRTGPFRPIVTHNKGNSPNFIPLSADKPTDNILAKLR